MSVKAEWLRYGKNHEHLGFVAWMEKAKASLPAVIVIQEAWGVDEHIKDVTTRFAQAGYLACAPDLFAVNGERPAEFAPKRMANLKEFLNQAGPAAWSDSKAREDALAKMPLPLHTDIVESFQALTKNVIAQMDQFVPLLVETAHYLRSEHPLSRGAKIGAVGYCMGGALSGKLACADPLLNASVIYYGNAPDLDLVPNISCPVMGFYGGLDTRVNAGIAEFAQAMEKHQKCFEHYIYEKAQHAFFNDTRPAYDATASRDAFARTLEFFRRMLS